MIINFCDVSWNFYGKDEIFWNYSVGVGVFRIFFARSHLFCRRNQAPTPWTVLLGCFDETLCYSRGGYSRWGHISSNWQVKLREKQILTKDSFSTLLFVDRSSNQMVVCGWNWLSSLILNWKLPKITKAVIVMKGYSYQCLCKKVYPKTLGQSQGTL